MTIPLSLLVIHFVADFLFQTDSMALKKSTSNEWLALHALVYSACFLPFGLVFALITFVTHFWVDYYTSRCTSKLWFIDLYESEECGLMATVKDWKRHWFFVMIGFDQLLHFSILALTYKTLFGT